LRYDGKVGNNAFRKSFDDFTTLTLRRSKRHIWSNRAAFVKYSRPGIADNQAGIHLWSHRERVRGYYKPATDLYREGSGPRAGWS
jgi:hypothetical protein